MNNVSWITAQLFLLRQKKTAIQNKVSIVLLRSREVFVSIMLLQCRYLLGLKVGPMHQNGYGLYIVVMDTDPFLYLIKLNRCN